MDWRAGAGDFANAVGNFIRLTAGLFGRVHRGRDLCEFAPRSSWIGIGTWRMRVRSSCNVLVAQASQSNCNG